MSLTLVERKAAQLLSKEWKGSEKIRLVKLLWEMEQLRYLQSGPDDYDTIDSITIYSADETLFKYDNPIWSMSLLNDGANDIDIRFTETFGRTKKVRIKTTDTEFNIDLKGVVASFKAQGVSGNSTLRGIVWLKRPFYPSVYAGGEPVFIPELQQEPIPGVY